MNGTVVVNELFKAIASTKAKGRKDEEGHGAGEPVSELRRAAHHARSELREGQRLARKNYQSLNERGQTVVDAFISRKLHVNVDKENKGTYFKMILN